LRQDSRRGQCQLHLQAVDHHDDGGWQVGDIEEFVGRLTRHGITFERYSWMDQDAAGVWTAPSGARIAWFKDPDGNLLSIAQYH
jgi:hypothetical protein